MRKRFYGIQELKPINELFVCRVPSYKYLLMVTLMKKHNKQLEYNHNTRCLYLSDRKHMKIKKQVAKKLDGWEF